MTQSEVWGIEILGGRKARYFAIIYHARFQKVYSLQCRREKLFGIQGLREMMALVTGVFPWNLEPLCFIRTAYM